MGGKRIGISVEGIVLEAEILPNETGEAIYTALPITGVVNRWGEEIYFAIPLDLALSPDARDVVEFGELGYWPQGKAFCIFFGKTPASWGDEIRAASPVAVFGKVDGDARVLADVPDGAEITITVLT
jgi:hypothetical protein